MTQVEAAALTVLIEAAVGALVAPICGARRRDLALGLAAASMASHPLVWALNTAWAGRLAFAPRAAVLESFAVGAEAIALGLALSLPWRRALLASTLANGTSFGIGLLIWWSRSR